MTTHHTFAGGLRIVDHALRIYVCGAIWDASTIPGVQPGDYVTVAGQDITGGCLGVIHEGRTGLVLRLAGPAEARSQVAAALAAASMRANGKSMLPLDQAQAITDQLMESHEAAGRRLHSLHALLASLRADLCCPASASPAPASAGSPAPGQTAAAPAPARPIDSPAHSFGPIQLDQTGPQGRRRAACLNWA